MNVFNNFQPQSEKAKIFDEILNKHSTLKSFLIGSFSGTCSTLLFQPLDLVKTRIQSGAFTITSKHAMVSVVNEILKNESVLSLWRGTFPSLLRCVPGVGLYFSSLDWLQTKLLIAKTLNNNKRDENKHLTLNAFEAITIGLIARTFAGVTLLPFTVLKTRYESGLFNYNSLMNAFQVTYKQEGFKGLYRGVSPTLLRDAPFSGIYFMFFSQLKKLLINYEQKQQQLSNSQSMVTIEPFIIFSFGLTSGLFASVLTHPADVVKTKVQVDSNKYKNIFIAVKIIYNEKGAAGFFAGLAPRMIRRTLMASMAWTVYEGMMKNIGLK